MKASRISRIVQRPSHRTTSRNTNSASIRGFSIANDNHAPAPLNVAKHAPALRSNNKFSTFHTSGLIKRCNACQIVLCTPIASCRVGASQRRYTSQSSSPSDTLKKTALHDLHVANGGKMVPFGGYSMPVQYSDLGVGESHKWTREKASLFDVGHM